MKLVNQRVVINKKCTLPMCASVRGSLRGTESGVRPLLHQKITLLRTLSAHLFSSRSLTRRDAASTKILAQHKGSHTHAYELTHFAFPLFFPFFFLFSFFFFFLCNLNAAGFFYYISLIKFVSRRFFAHFSAIISNDESCHVILFLLFFSLLLFPYARLLYT